MAGLFFLTGAGGVTFAWLVYRWQNLWVGMNLCWELFSVAKSAIGGWFPFMLQNLTMLLAIFITLVSDTLRGGNCNVSRLTNPTKPSLLSKPVIELVFFRSPLVLLCYKLNTFC